MTQPLPESPRMRALRRDLDLAAERAGGEIVDARVLRRTDSALAESLPLLAAVPGLYALSELGQWTKDEPAHHLPIILVAGLTVALPLAWSWLQARKVRRTGVPRSDALGAVDRHLGLEGRLLAADEFMAIDERDGFQQAALEDASRRAHEAVRRGLDLRVERLELRRDTTRWSVAGAALLVAAVLLAGLERTPRFSGETDRVAVAGAGIEGGSLSDAVESKAERPDAPESSFDPARTEPRAEGQAARESRDAVEVTGEAKESAGKTGSGRSSGAMSSSAPSQSKSSPSSQGKSSTPSKPEVKKKRDSKKPKDTETEPRPQEPQEDEPSGSTAGKGSSKGSNKNPTASDWKSRDQVTEQDDQEIDDDEETDDDEEEQENRGGVQPSLRDRRPPVSRDLQIGFGNRPSPDANGRGGPSEQKKSRGVASLVLGVPIPDRIKGRPGPGPTKITQERIEPEAEEVALVEAGARTPRHGSLERPTALRLDPSLRAAVRGYFLQLRRAASQQTSSN